MDSEGDFDDDALDEFEESRDEPIKPKRDDVKISNKPYDEAFEFSQDLSVAESFDGRDKKSSQPRERKLENDKYDEAVDVSMSMDQGNSPAKGPDRSRPAGGASGAKDYSPEALKTTSISNRPFDEAFEVSQSGSEESFDSNESDRKLKAKTKAMAQMKGPTPIAASKVPMPAQLEKPKQPSPKGAKVEDYEDSGEEDEDDENADESYENLEGAYNPKDYSNLNATADVKDLFQYIERYKPQEVELDTVLKCFIPEYIPAIGEIDSFVKIPRPNDQLDDLGLKFLDEPAAMQSDPTVLELQLRARSKKQQYGDVSVRSIENAPKNSGLIDKWIQNISDLHRSKPPPQVHYKRNMPDPDQLMDVWPEKFEEQLRDLDLPSPDLDLTLAEFAKVLCSIVDIPTYENPIESLHVLFSLYMDFKNNSHFQAMQEKDMDDAKLGNEYGGDDFLEVGGPEYK